MIKKHGKTYCYLCQNVINKNLNKNGHYFKCKLNETNNHIDD